MRFKLCLMLLMVLAISATSAFATDFFYNVGVGVGTGMSQDGVAISYNNGGISYIYSQAYGSVEVAGANNVGIAKVGNDYAVAYNSSSSGSSKAYVWKGSLDGTGTTTVDPFSTTASSYFYARCIAGDANQAYVGGQTAAASTQAARWKAPAGSVATYGQPGNFNSSLYYFYGASNIGTYAGWGRLSAAGTVANKSQAMTNEGSTLISLKNAWGAPSTSYFSNAYISGDGQTCFGYTGASDNSSTLPCYWNRSEYGTFTTNTTCNLIPVLDGYEKGYAMKSDSDASVIAGWTIKAAGTWGIDRRTVFLYDKYTGQLSDLRTVLAAAGVDMSAWGLMDITGVSSDGRILSGTMLSAEDTYWTTGAVGGPYNTWIINLDGDVVPEPSSFAALSLGLLPLLRRRRK